MLNRWQMQIPLFETPGDGGGGDAGGGGVFDTGGNAAPAADTAIELNDDSLVRVKGEKDPLKWKDYSSRYVPKSEFTKTTQERAAYAKQYQQAQLALRERDARLSEIERQRQGANPPQNPIGELVKQLESQPYLDGKTAASLVTNIFQQGIQPLAQAIGQRDEVIKLLWQRLQGVDTTVGTLSGSKRESEFASNLSRVKTDLGLPDDPVVDEMLKDIYLSHEGDDLDHEFPNMVKARWDSIQKVVRALDQKRTLDGRRQALNPALQGKGGQGTPSRPLRNKVAQMSAKDAADALWPLLQNGDGT